MLVRNDLLPLALILPSSALTPELNSSWSLLVTRLSEHWVLQAPAHNWKFSKMSGGGAEEGETEVALSLTHAHKHTRTHTGLLLTYALHCAEHR